MKDTAIAFGSNSKDAFTILNAVAKSFFSWYSIFSSVDISSIVESEALDRRQRTYINCVFLLTTNLDVMRLLSICEELESAFGRREKGSGRSRTLDLDIIFYDELHIASPRLTLPHSEAHKREFVVYPLWSIHRDLLLNTYSVSRLLYSCELYGKILSFVTV